MMVPGALRPLFDELLDVMERAGFRRDEIDCETKEVYRRISGGDGERYLREKVQSIGSLSGKLPTRF